MLNQIINKYVLNELCYKHGSPSVQHISSTQKGHSFSVPKNPQFHTKNISVQHTPQFHTKKPSVLNRKPLRSAPKTHQFHTPLSSTHGSVQHTPQFHTKNLSVPPPLVPHQKSPIFLSPCLELRGALFFCPEVYKYLLYN